MITFSVTRELHDITLGGAALPEKMRWLGFWDLEQPDLASLSIGLYDLPQPRSCAFLQQADAVMHYGA